MDKALDAIADARAAETEAVAIILTHAPGKQTQEFIHLGHAVERIMARLGDCGIARDVRWDKSAPSPRLAEVAKCHAHIRKPEPVIRKPTKSKRAA
jgi:hypothetical protein